MAFEKLHNFLADHVPGEYGPGCDILIYRHGELVHREQFGYQDYLQKEPMSGEVYYPIYSCSKVVTCAAVLHLIEEGRVGLDDAVSQYIPAFSEMRLVSGEIAKTPITLRHCFTMTTGLDYDLWEPHLLEAIRKNPHATALELATAIAKRPLHFEPGTHFKYSLSHDILAAVAEAVTGKNFEEYLQEWCFEPLGLQAISMYFNEENRSNLVAQVAYNNGSFLNFGGSCEFILTDRYCSGGAGLLTKAEDYAKILAALSMGTAGGLLKDETLALMQQNQMQGAVLSDFRSSEYSAPYGYGLGVRVMMEPEVQSIDPRIREFGWSGAAGSHAIIDTEHQLAVFFARCVRSNTPELSFQLRAGLRDLIYEEILK